MDVCESLVFDLDWELFNFLGKLSKMWETMWADINEMKDLFDIWKRL